MAELRRLLGDDRGLDRDLLGIGAFLPWSVTPKTASPILRSLTPSPNTLTTPEKSRPRMCGKFTFP
jgi:hypothetical protein